jgi:hypothetical protein
LSPHLNPLPKGERKKNSKNLIFPLTNFKELVYLIEKYKEKVHEGGLWFPPDSFLAPLYPNQRKPSSFFGGFSGAGSPSG